MKSLIILNILTAVVLMLSIAVTGYNITYGYIGPYDRLLARHTFVKPSSFFGKQTLNYVYPPKGLTSYVTLSAIRIHDRGGPKNFGYASLKKGGPGFRNATILLKSQRNRPLNFTIEFFGH